EPVLAKDHPVDEDLVPWSLSGKRHRPEDGVKCPGPDNVMALRPDLGREQWRSLCAIPSGDVQDRDRRIHPRIEHILLSYHLCRTALVAGMTGFSGRGIEREIFFIREDHGAALPAEPNRYRGRKDPL